MMLGFTHAGKMVPVRSHDDFSRPLVEKGVKGWVIGQELFSVSV